MRFGMRLTVRHPGFFTLVQDLGRVGFRKYGVSVGGALDPHAFSIWDVKTSRWTTLPGKYELSVGTSSRDLPLETSVRVE